jgi:hypothetical protein
MANAQNENANGLVLNVADYAVIADAITPKAAERTTHRLAELPRIVLFADALVEKIDNPTGHGSAQLL